MKQDILYIGLHGLAGSGKDTLAKILALLLNNNYDSFERFKADWESTLKNDPRLATFNSNMNLNDKSCICIAFADQLKYICANMFGIPVDRFYYNKSNAWVCVNKDFRYTEIEPNKEYIIDAEEYYYGHDRYQNSTLSYFMSLRDVLVYVGTYICQTYINRNVFINIVNNEIERLACRNRNLKYVILTDVRFQKEMQYVYDNNGIMINIYRDEVAQLENIAEHDMDDISEYNINIDNSGTYDELLETVWNLVHENVEIQNKITKLYTRDGGNENYLRMIKDDEEGQAYKLCTSYNVNRIKHSDGTISMIDPSGGPAIYVGSLIEGTNIIPRRIALSDIGDKFVIYT